MKKIVKQLFSCNIDGYMTLEMSLVMPFVLFLICNICFGAVFLYDNSTMNQGAYVTALMTERTNESQDRIGKANIKYEESVRSRLVGVSETSSINISNKGVTVSSRINMHTPANWIYKSIWNAGCEQTANRYEPVMFVRNIRNIKYGINID